MLVIHRDLGHIHPLVKRWSVGVLWLTLSTIEGEPGISPVPSFVCETIADPNWHRAMEEEYAVLFAN